MSTHVEPCKIQWQATDDDVSKVHAYFGGRVCWLKNGETECGKPYDDPIHKIEYLPCEHVYLCEKCGDELSHTAQQ